MRQVRDLRVLFGEGGCSSPGRQHLPLVARGSTDGEIVAPSAHRTQEGRASYAPALTYCALPQRGGPAEYPEKPITLIVPFAAGGPTDLIARLVAEHMTKTLGQPIIIENVPGAGGTTAARRGAQAPADGYIIVMGSMGTHGAAPAVYPDLKY